MNSHTTKHPAPGEGPITGERSGGRGAGRLAEKSEATIARALETALELFATKGYGATSIREISNMSGVSMGNLYHHFGSKEAIFHRLIEDFWKRLADPENPLQEIYRRAGFPDDLEEIASGIKRSVEQNAPYIKLIFIDVIEFEGEHLRAAYDGMASAFAEIYTESVQQRKSEGGFGDIDPLVGVMFVSRWLFYFYSLEVAFGVPMHFGMTEEHAVSELFRILRYGLLPRTDASAGRQGSGQQTGTTGEKSKGGGTS